MKTAMIGSNGAALVALLLVGFLVLVASPTEAAPHVPRYNPEYYSEMNVDNANPEYIMQTLARLRQALLAEEDLENSKRGLDLGLGRGFSGSQAAKHLMGLAAANFAGGPGRRRRSGDAA